MLSFSHSEHNAQVYLNLVAVTSWMILKQET